MKWGRPCYIHADRNIVIIGAFREDFRISFFYSALMTEPASVLKKGPNTSHPDAMRLTKLAQVAGWNR